MSQLQFVMELLKREPGLNGKLQLMQIGVRGRQTDTIQITLYLSKVRSGGKKTLLETGEKIAVNDFADFV